MGFQFSSHLLKLFFLKLFVISETAVYFSQNYKAVIVKDSPSWVAEKSFNDKFKSVLLCVSIAGVLPLL